MKRTAWLLLPFAWALAATAAFAAEDFDPKSADWNGLAGLLETAGLAKVEVELLPVLDWSTIATEDVLFVLAPQTAPQGESLRSLERFVDSGGRLMVADDFGAGDAWLRPFGIELLDRAGRQQARFLDLEHLPQVRVDPEPETVMAARRWMAPKARLTPAEFLSHDVNDPVVLNHPAALRVSSALAADRLAVLWGRYDEPGLGWLAEADRGAGRVLAIADPSLFITSMLSKFHDNKQFTANVLRYSCVASRPCKVKLAVRIDEVRGRFQGLPIDRNTDLRSGLEVLQRALEWLATALRGPLVAPALLATLLFLLAWPPWRLARSPQPEVPPRTAGLRRESARLTAIGAWLSHDHADYRRPARLLAAHLGRQLEAAERMELSDGQGEAIHAPRAPSGRGARMGAILSDTGFGLTGRTQTIDRLVRRGRCSAQAADRLRKVFRELELVSRDDGEPLNRSDFTRLSAEVEWAESLIGYTRDPAVVRNEENA
jgi:hypothetical protein